MRRKIFTSFRLRVIALILALIVLVPSLSGCASLIGLLRYYVTYAGYVEYFEEYQFNYTDQEYEKFRDAQDRVATLLSYNTEGVRSDVVDAFRAYYNAYIRLGSQYQLSMLNYSLTPNDEQTVSDYEEMSVRYNEAYAQYMEILTTVVDSIFRDELMGDFTEELIEFVRNQARTNTPEILELNNRNDELVLKQHELDPTDPSYAQKNDVLYAEFSANNRRIAELLGDATYMDYAGWSTYNREFKMEDIVSFLRTYASYADAWYVRAEDAFNSKVANLTETQLTELSMLLYEEFYKPTQKKRIEGFMAWMPDSFSKFYKDVNEKYQCIFTGSAEDGSRDGAFTTTLASTGVPIMYFGPGAYSGPFTFVHEFGHAFNQFSTRQSDIQASFEFSETTSQADEALFMIYLKNEVSPEVYDVLRAYYLVNTIQDIELALAVTMFEEEIYRTGETDFEAVMEETCELYTPHLFDELGDRLCTYIRQVTMDSPAYYMSYALSLTPCLELYMTASDPTVTKDTYQTMYITLVTDRVHTYRDALKNAGFSDPFSEETIRKLDAFLG